MSSEASTKIYTIDEIIKMLPLIRSIANSLKRNAKEIVEIYLNKKGEEQEVVDLLMKQAGRRYQECKDELQKLGMRTCNQSEGFINVPIEHPHNGYSIYACIDQDTTKDTIMAHLVTERFDERRDIWNL
jgi:hypothetical protein